MNWISKCSLMNIMFLLSTRYQWNNSSKVCNGWFWNHNYIQAANCQNKRYQWVWPCDIIRVDYTCLFNHFHLFKMFKIFKCTFIIIFVYPSNMHVRQLTPFSQEILKVKLQRNYLKVFICMEQTKEIKNQSPVTVDNVRVVTGSTKVRFYYFVSVTVGTSSEATMAM